MTSQEQCVLVAQHDRVLSQRIVEELGKAGLRVAGPVADLDHALARPESQVISVAIVDLFLPKGADAIGRFRGRYPSLPVIATAPRRFESRARKAVTEGARLYLLDEEFGRGLAVPVVLHAARGTPGDTSSADEWRRLLHDLGNLLAVASGESEMLLAKATAANPLTGDLRDLHAAIAESVNVFRQFVAARRFEAAGPPPP